MTTEIVVGSHIVDNTERVIATLTTWHPKIDVYVNPNGDPLALGTMWRVYALTGGIAALIGEGQFTSTNLAEGQRVIAGLDGGGTTIQLRAVTNNLPTVAAIGGGIVGYDPSEAIAAIAEEDTGSHTLGTPNVTFATLSEWFPDVEVVVDASADPTAVGSFWQVCATIPMFPPTVIAAATLTSIKQAIFRNIEAGAQTFFVRARTPNNNTLAITASILGYTGPAGGGGGGGTVVILDTASSALVAGDWICPVPSAPLKVTKAVPAAVLAAKSILGCVGASYAPGASLTYFAIGQVVDSVVFGDLGAGLATDLQLNANARAFRQAQVSGGEILVGTVDVMGNVTVKQIVPLNTATRLAYNPKTYGAAFDNVTDDLDAWNAMFADMATHAPNTTTGYLVEIPLGMSYVRDAVFFDRPCFFLGHSGGTQQPTSGIRSAPGKCAVIANNGITIPGYKAAAVGSDGSWFHAERLDLRSSAMVPEHVNPYVLQGGISTKRAPSTRYERGNCVLDAAWVYGGAVGNAGDGGSATCGNGTKFGVTFRITAATGDQKSSAAAESTLRDQGTGTRTFATAFPGDVFVDGNVTWTAEGLATKAIRNVNQKVGDVIMNVGADRYNGGTAFTQDEDNRYLFVCTVAGLTANTSLPVAFGQPEVGTTISWGAATYRVYVHAGVLTTAGSTTCRRITFNDFTNYGIHAWGQTGQGSSVDFSIFDNIFVQGNTGGGVFVGTDQAQGCKVGAIFVNFAGVITPGSTQVNNTGGHSYYSHSQGGEDVAMVYGQFSNGRNLFNLANNSVFRSCFSENGLPDLIAGGSFKIGGTTGPDGPTTPDGGVIFGGTGGYGRNLVEYDRSGPVAVGRGFCKQDGVSAAGSTIDWWTVGAENGTWQRMYQAAPGGDFNAGTGWTAMQWKTSGGQNGIADGYSQITAAQGPGFKRDYYGRFKGLEGGTIVWEGYYTATNDLALTWKQIRAGSTGATPATFNAGDTFEKIDQSSPGNWRWTVAATNAARRGKARANSTQYFTNGPADYAAATIQIGQKVFQCTTSGISNATLPAGYAAVAIGGTVSDGAAVFTRVNDAPVYYGWGFIEDPAIGQTVQTTVLWADTASTDAAATNPKGAVSSFRREAATANNTANQTLLNLDNSLFTQPVVTGSLPDNAVYTVNVLIQGKSPAGNAEVGSVTIAGTFYRNGGALVRVGTDLNVPNFLSGSTARLNINVNTIDVQVSPGVNSALGWEVSGQITRKVD